MSQNLIEHPIHEHNSSNRTNIIIKDDPSDINMPPASTMAGSNNGLLDIDPFSQFGQLSLDADNKPAAPETPPSAAPKTENQFAMTTAGGMVPGMNSGYHHQQQQLQQPMQVTPEQVANPAGPLIQHQQGQQPQAYSNYQYNPYGHPAPQMQQQQMQHPQAVTNNHPNNSNALQPSALLTSPPISPLWTPASPDASPPEGAPNMQQTANNGMMPSLPTGFGNAPAAPQAGAPMPTLSPSSPAANPFDMFAPAQAAPPANTAPVSTDPFATNVAVSPPAVAQQQQQPAQQSDEADFWNDMGFGAVAPSSSNSPGNVTPTSDNNTSDNSLSSVTSDTTSNSYEQDHSIDDTPVTLDDRGLPEGGEYYKARVTTPMLGAIFSSGKELRSTLFKTASNSFVEAIGERPVISFTIDGSAADTAGIGLGHVLLKVNDIEVSQTDEAVKTVGAAARPMIMEFYIPNKEVRVVKTEGQCMVKYDNHSTEAPASACEWKPKYVVVGDMLGKPHILYMYRSKAEYDIAVKESQIRNRALSVKVKQFDIRGAKIFHERGTVKYPNKPKWCYFTIVRGTGLPIKISARDAAELQPVYDGVVAFLEKEARMKKARLEQNRERMHMSEQQMYRETYY